MYADPQKLEPLLPQTPWLIPVEKTLCSATRGEMDMSKTPNSFSPSTPKSSEIAAEALTQCLQSERARMVKHSFQKKIINKFKQRCRTILKLEEKSVGSFKTYPVLNRCTQSMRAHRRARQDEQKVYNLFIYF